MSPFIQAFCLVPDCIPDYRNSVIVAKNPLSARRATSYAERLRLGIAVIHGEAKVSMVNANEKFTLTLLFANGEFSEPENEQAGNSANVYG